jgi:hypothetical protein
LNEKWSYSTMSNGNKQLPLLTIYHLATTRLLRLEVLPKERMLIHTKDKMECKTWVSSMSVSGTYVEMTTTIELDRSL